MPVYHLNSPLVTGRLKGTADYGAGKTGRDLLLLDLALPEEDCQEFLAFFDWLQRLLELYYLWFSLAGVVAVMALDFV